MSNQGYLKVIVVDDVPRICKLVTDFVNGIDGVKVVGTANTIKDALECISQLEPNIVVLDISMPSYGLIQNGVDVLRWIKSNYPATDVIMLTNHNEAVYRQVTHKLGAYAFLDKSGDSDLLYTAIAQLVKEQSNSSPASSSPAST